MKKYMLDKQIKKYEKTAYALESAITNCDICKKCFPEVRKLCDTLEYSTIAEYDCVDFCKMYILRNMTENIVEWCKDYDL